MNCHDIRHLPQSRTRRRCKKLRQDGFTLVEILACTFLLGLLMVLLSPTIRDGYSAVMRAANGRQALNNQNIASVLLDSARTQSLLGQLPPPYSGSSFRSTVLDPSDSGLVGLFTQAGMLPRDVNTDGTAAQNVRVYQRANGLTMQVPLYFRSGPLVTLSYQVGVVYSTRCGVYDGGCSTGPSGVPGASPALTCLLYTSPSPRDS